MTIDELIALAGEAREDLGGDAQVRIAFQPGYPVRAALQYVTIPHSSTARTRRPPARATTARSCGWPQATSRTVRTPTPPGGPGSAPTSPDRGTATGVPGGHLASSQRAVTGVLALAARLRDDHGCPVFTSEYGGLPPRREHHARGVPVPEELEERNLRGKEGAAHAATKDEGPEPAGRLRSGAGRPSSACCYMPSHDAKAASESVRRRSWRVSTRTVSRTWGW
jgi:hypothetical protein